MNELKVPCKLVESLGTDPPCKKHPGPLKHNQAGLVPATVQTDSTGGVSAFCESLNILQDLFLTCGEDKEEVEVAMKDASDWN